MIKWNVFTLSCQEKGSQASLLAFAPKQMIFYSTLFPRFQVFYGPTFSKGFDSEVLHSLLQELCRAAEQHHAISLFVRTPFPFPYGYEVFRENGFERDLGGGECSVLIDLEHDTDTIWKNMKRFARRCVKKALSKGVEVCPVETEEELREFYDMYVSTGRRRGFYPYPFSLFEALWRHLEPRGFVKLFTARLKNRAIAGILNTVYEKESVPWFACSLDGYWDFRPNHLLFWNSIRWSKEAVGASLFKLYHVPSKREKIQGVDHFTFKTCFGGQLVEECTFYSRIFSTIRSAILNMRDRLPKSAIYKILLFNS